VVETMEAGSDELRELLGQWTVVLIFLLFLLFFSLFQVAPVYNSKHTERRKHKRLEKVKYKRNKRIGSS
jgi:hypothetical protein